jgi:hypothetical protein
MVKRVNNTASQSAEFQPPRTPPQAPRGFESVDEYSE